MTDTVRVFVSYAHDSEEHKSRVLLLCRILRDHGMEICVDQWEDDCRRDWFTWATRRITEADFVVVVASPGYRLAGDGVVSDDTNRGVQTEASLLRDLLHCNRSIWLSKLLPVVLPGGSVSEIPLFLQPSCADHYIVEDFSPAGLGDLLRALNSRSQGRVPPDGRQPVYPLASTVSPRLRAAVSTVATLPRDTGGFAGRETELDDLIAETAAGRWVHIVHGMPGVGKTAFVVNAAHRLAPQYPDGQLFVELHGHSTTWRAVEPEVALGSLLMAVGVPASQVPQGLHDRARLWRSSAAGKRLLIVLDDAAGYEQLLPLLPGVPGCLVLITSRRRLTGPCDARSVSLDVLPACAAIDMFLRLVQRPDVAHDLCAVAELVDLCGDLPLAIELSAGKLRSHGSWTVGHLTEELARARSELAGSHSANLAIAASFDLSYRNLAESEQRFLRRISLHPGNEIEVHAAAKVNFMGTDAATRHLDVLYFHNLIEEVSPGRYRLHDLVREYASKLTRDDPQEENERSISELLDYYLYATLTARRHVHAIQPLLYPVGPETSVTHPALVTESAALNWLAAEYQNICSCIEYSACAVHGSYAIKLALTLHPFLRMHGHWDEIQATHRIALKIAHNMGDPTAEAALLANLADMAHVSGDFAAAKTLFGNALALFERLGDRAGRAGALIGLGTVCNDLRERDSAIRRLGDAHTLSYEVGDILGRASSLHALGRTRAELEEFCLARKLQCRALALYIEAGNKLGIARVFDSLGSIDAYSCEYGSALHNYRCSLRLSRELGDCHGEARTLNNIGFVQVAIGQYPAALENLMNARRIFVALGDKLGEGNTLNYTGRAQIILGELEDAAISITESHAISTGFGAPLGQARSWTSLGVLHSALGDTSVALSSLQEAYGLYERLENQRGMAEVLVRLGEVWHSTGDFQDAKASLEQACKLASQYRYRDIHVHALNAGGLLVKDCVDGNRASRLLHEHALAIARKIGFPMGEAKALEGIGRSHLRVSSSSPQGISLLSEALVIYRRLGVDDARRVEVVLRASLGKSLYAARMQDIDEIES